MATQTEVIKELRAKVNWYENEYPKLKEADKDKYLLIKELNNEIDSLRIKVAELQEYSKKLNFITDVKIQKNFNPKYTEGKYCFVIHEGGFENFVKGDTFKSDLELHNKFPENIKLIDEEER